VWRYLKGSHDYGLTYEKSTINSILVGFSDASYASTSNARYYSLGTDGQDTIFLMEFIATIEHEQAHPTVVFENNIACLSIANNPVTSQRARHIKVRYHYIR
jgi:hypothetical protein